MAVLITGAAGFIGSHLSERLVREGETVVGYDVFGSNYSPVLKENNLMGLRENPRFHLVRGDIADGPALRAVFERFPVEAVVHLAALPGVTPSLSDPTLYMAVNVTGTSRVLQECLAAGVKNVLLASSSSVYGNTSTIPFVEEDPALDAVSPYGVSKRAMEMVARCFQPLGIPNLALLRLFTVYGPRQRPEMAIHRFTRMILAGEELPLFGYGETERDYTYVDDIVEGIVRLIRQPQGLLALNLGSDRPISLRGLVDLIGRAVGVEPRVKLLPHRRGDVDRTWAGLDLARRTIGYQPSVTIEEGVARFVHWYRERRDLLEREGQDLLAAELRKAS